MKSNNDILEGVAILIVLILITLVIPRGTFRLITPPGSNASSTSRINTVAPKSSRVPQVSLGPGNAAYAYQPYEEYVTLYNRSTEPVDITGWQLKNGKGKRAYDFGGTLRYFPADIAVIPRAARFISPRGSNVFQNVVLQPGETAIITTGLVGSQTPFKIVSFKENSCSGFLEDLPEYNFTPSLARDCPRPADEPGVSNLDTECRGFIERMASCRTPQFDTRDSKGDICDNCVDGKALSGSCVAFIKNHFNYNSCLAGHANDPNFSGRTWRIFLGRGWEIWAKKYETIELFDQFGRLVDHRAY